MGHVGGGGGGEVEHDMGPWGGKDSCCKRGAGMRGVCDGLIGAFHGGGGGYAKVHILLHLLHLRILVCATFFEFILYFLEKISWLSGVVVGWLWCHLFGRCPLFC